MFKKVTWVMAVGISTVELAEAGGAWVDGWGDEHVGHSSSWCEITPIWMI